MYSNPTCRKNKPKVLPFSGSLLGPPLSPVSVGLLTVSLKLAAAGFIVDQFPLPHRDDLRAYAFGGKSIKAIAIGRNESAMAIESCINRSLAELDRVEVYVRVLFDGQSQEFSLVDMLSSDSFKRVMWPVADKV